MVRRPHAPDAGEVLVEIRGLVLVLENLPKLDEALLEGRPHPGVVFAREMRLPLFPRLELAEAAAESADPCRDVHGCLAGPDDAVLPQPPLRVPRLPLVPELILYPVPHPRRRVHEVVQELALQRNAVAVGFQARLARRVLGGL